MIDTEMTNTSGAQAIIDAATRAAEPRKLDDAGRFFAVATADGDVKLIDLYAERDQFEYANKPRRKTGTYKVHDANSFVAYLAKHADQDTEVWADQVAAKITGVLDAHGNRAPSDARHEQHRVEYAVLYTPAWKAWAARDGKLLRQDEFAEHIEDRLVDIVDPSAADMLELAQSFHATTDVTFKSSKRLSSGERQLQYREQVEAGAGRDGLMEIPEKFVLGLQPFEGAEAFRVTARFRYRIADGHLFLGYKLERPEDVIREAFSTVVAAVQDGVEALDRLNSPILLGSR